MSVDKGNRAEMKHKAIDRVVRCLACCSGMLVAYVLASVLHTQTVLAGLTSLGVEVPMSDRWRMSWHDLLGLWAYGLTIVVALSLGFLIMSAVSRRVQMPLPVSLVSGGVVAFATLLLAMETLLSITPIASARSTGGFLLQCCAGGVGGAVAALNLTIWKNFDSIEASSSTDGRSADEHRES